MSNSLNILVMGVGGNVGQGILKALSLCNIPHRTVGACVSPLACGLYTTDRSYVSPYFRDAHFLDWVLDICQTEQIDVILTGVEPVLTMLAEKAEEIKAKTGAICITSKPEALTLAQDKLLTCQWLEQHGFHFPYYALANDAKALQELVARCGYRLIGKPRFGRGGAGIIEIKDEQGLHLAAQHNDYLIQEYLGDAASEFTVGCFSDKNGKVCGTIVMKRELLSGTTYRAEIGDYPVIRAEAERIVSALKPMGACNLQFRLRADGVPVCFEINMRFSGTTPLRARFGFNEVQATLDHYILGKAAISLPLVTKGIALRYWNEAYIDVDAYDELRTTGKLHNPKQFELMIENYGGVT